MCGICAIVTVNKLTCETDLRLMLQKLRHRGYDSWGVSHMCDSDAIICSHSSEPILISDNADIIQTSNYCFLSGHTRYTTKGSHTSLSQAQPLINQSQTISLVHNGQIESPLEGCSDSQYMLQLIEKEFSSFTAVDYTNTDTIANFENLFFRLFRQMHGSFACILQVLNIGMFAFRDSRGIRPLCFQQSKDTIMFASESCALDPLLPINNVAPGEVIFVNTRGDLIRLHPIIEPQFYPAPCLFEFIYLADDESVIDGICVFDARKEMGKLLADPVRNSGLHIDIIIPIPHTPVLAGKVLAETLGVKCVEALQVASPNRRESRTFILPTQSVRESAVQNKFCKINQTTINQCQGKNILLLDDSIVRGTTLIHVIKLIRESIRPAALYVASLSPPIINTNHFGIDIPTTDLLVAANATQPIPIHVQTVLGVDGPVIYQSLDILKNGLKKLSQTGVSDFEDSVFVAAPK